MFQFEAVYVFTVIFFISVCTGEKTESPCLLPGSRCGYIEFHLAPSVKVQYVNLRSKYTYS